jgi:hypothetical protein
LYVTHGNLVLKYCYELAPNEQFVKVRLLFLAIFHEIASDCAKLTLSVLPVEKQNEALDFILFLQGRVQSTPTVTEEGRGQRIRDALQTLAELKTFSEISDPVAHQKSPISTKEGVVSNLRRGGTAGRRPQQGASV